MSSQAVWAEPAANQLPTGGSIAAGTVSISTSGSKMQIDQTSDKAIINWQNFSIGKDGWVNFSQPSSSSVALNRSMQPAEVFGRLSANGQVFVTSSAGVYFGRTAQVDVGGLVATNLSIRDQDFMAGRYVFFNEGSSGSVVNDGTIITPAGYAALAGTQVRNNGVIVAQAGTVALAAGDRVTLDMIGDGLIKVSVDAAALNALALNSGTIQADGGRVVLTARGANALLDTVVNNTGVIRARSLVERNGEIVLDGGSAGVVANNGSIDAAGTSGTRGGSVQVTGQYVALTEGSSINASGDAGGGTVTVKAVDAGFVYGTITVTDAGGNGKGGSVETSGKYLEVTRAPNVGAGGTWLIDPYNIDVVEVAPPPGYSNNTGPTGFTPSGDNSQIAASLITDQLNAGANVILDTGGAGSPGMQVGDIRVLAAVDKTVANPASLTLKAFHDVQVSQPISIASAFGPTGFGTLTIDAGNDVVVSAPITTVGGGLSIRAGGFTNQSAINNGVGGDLKPGMAIFADRFDLAGGTINGGLGSVGLFTRTATNSLGVESAGDTRITNADIATITTSPDTPATNANQLLIGVGSAGTMTIGSDAQVNGGGKNLVFTAGGGAGTRVTVGANGVTSTGDVAIDGTGGSIAATGTISGNHVVLRASTGIGTPTARVSTAANTLAVNTGGNAYLSEADNVTLDNVVLAGASVSNSVGGALDFAANGSVTVGGIVFAGSGMNVNVGQDLNVVGAPGRSAILTTNGQQTVTASNISLQAAASGTNGRAIIANTGGTADQTINVTGALRITGGDSGVTNTSAILTNGNQAINGNTEITLTGGASGTGSVAAQTQNSASIQSNGAGKTQTINAAKITLKAGGGNDTFASISAANQFITVAGDVDIKGGSGTGVSIARIGGIGTPAGATNLNLSARDVTITGGDAVTGEAGLGGTVLGTGPQPNTINISASRDVTLNGGTGGARIGSSLNFAAPATGNILVLAGRDIELKGAAAPAGIRSAEFVGLNATGSITETGNGFIQAGTLSTTSNGATNLAGPNLVNSFLAQTLGGDLTFSNTGTLSLPQVLVTGNATITNTGDVSVTNSVNASGALTMNVAGAVKLDADVTHDAFVSSNGQTINAQSLSVTSRDGRTALLSSGSGDQTISITGGSVDVRLLSPTGIAQVSSFAPTSNQSITVTDGDHIRVEGTTVFAGGNQTVSIAGSGRNAIELGSAATPRGSVLAASRNQTVTAGTGAQSGSITITGPAASGTGISGFVTNAGVGADTQTISTSGTLRVTGGTAPAQVPNLNSGIFHNRQGQQTITAADIVVEGGASGSNNSAFISTNGPAPGGQGPGGGDQVINVSGSIQLLGSETGANNRALITANRNQTINGNPDIAIHAGASGVSNTVNAGIIANTAGQQQAINAGNLTMSNAASSGIDSVAAIQGTNQVINATGNVTLTGGASGGTLAGVRIGGFGGAASTASNVTMDIDGSLVLTGGAANNGVGIGSSAASSQPNTLNIHADGNIILNPGSGAGARIGGTLSDPGGGNIVVSAGGNIELNGVTQRTTIRTNDNVTLSAGGSITENSNGFIAARELTTSSGGAQNLVGPNQVGSLNATTFGGDLTFNNAGNLNFAATTFNSLVAGNAVITNAGDVSVNGFVSISGALTMNVAGALKLEADATHDASISSNGQTINAQSLLVRSRDNRLALLSNNSGDQIISIAGGSIDVENLNLGGAAQISGFGLGSNQSLTVTNGDHINVNGGTVSTGGNQTISITGSGANRIDLGSLGTPRGSILLAGRNQTVTAGTGAQNGSIAITGPGTSNTGVSGIVTISGVGAETQTVSTSGSLRVTGGTAPAQVPNVNSGIFHNRQGQQTITAADIIIQGGASGSNNGALIATSGPNAASPGGGNQVIHVPGTIVVRGSDNGFNNRAAIFSNANQTIDGDPDIFITAGSAGGAVGLGNTAGINTAAGRLQTIRAGTIELTSGAGGIDATAFISGGVQDISTTGDLKITGGGSGGTRGAALIGGPGGGAVLQPTILTLSVGRDLILTGGSGALDAASIGSSALGTGTPSNDITITAGRDVILNSGSGAGARIGTSVIVAPTDGHLLVTAGRNIELNGAAQSTVIRTAGSVELHAGGTISEGVNGFVVASTLDTTSGDAQNLVGPNQVSSFTATSTGDVSLRNTASTLTLGNMDFSGSLTIDQTGALAVPGTVSALNQSIQASGDVTIGAASGTGAAGLFAPGTITISTPQSVVLRGSDLADGGTSMVSAGGLVTVNAGELHLTGGAAPLAAASVLGGDLVVTTARNIELTSGSGWNANALLYSANDITLTVGGLLVINGGHSLDNWAKVQTEQYDGTITLNLPNASSGSFSVDGFVGRIKHGQDGLFTADKPAKLGETLFINYGL